MQEDQCCLLPKCLACFGCITIVRAGCRDNDNTGACWASMEVQYYFCRLCGCILENKTKNACVSVQNCLKNSEFTLIRSENTLFLKSMLRFE